MALFDFIKKRENPSSQLPTFQNYGQSPESFSNFQFSRGENTQNSGFDGKNPQNGIRVATDQSLSASPSPQRETINANIDYNSILQDEEQRYGGINPQSNRSYEDTIASIIKKSYKNKEENTKRARAADFWGSLANLFGQTVAASMGSRTIAPVTSNTQSYNNAILNIKNGYEDAMLNYTLANAKANQAAKAQADKINLQFERDKAMAELNAKLKGGLIDKQEAANLKMQIQKAKDAKELQQLRDKASMQRTEYAQQSQNQRAERGDQAAMEREKFRQQEITKRNGSTGTSTSKKKKKYPVMKFGSSGETYDMNKDTDVARMYNKGVEIGYFPEPIIDSTSNKGMTVDDMREAILTATDQKRNVKRPARKTIEGFSTSSGNKKTIEGF